MYDLLLKNGTIYDGTGASGYVADIGVAQGRIAAIGALEGDSAQTIDVSGLAVSPGFIDLHTHSDFSFLLDNSAQSKVRQGCTLEPTGNCGSSYCAPLHGEAHQIGKQRMEQYGVGPMLDWTTFDEYLTRLEGAGSTLNLAAQVGHGTVRTCVIGFEDRAPTPEELDRMRVLVAFDPGTVTDAATLEDPHNYPSGIPHVVVNGEPVIRDGEFTQASPGKVLRRFDG